MLGFKLFFPALLIVQALATAIPAPAPGDVSVGGPVTCGKYPHQQAQIRGALKKGVKLMNQKQKVQNFPHKYKNIEEFKFPVKGPYQEFPILRDGQLYDGGDPGMDRVIFNDQGEYVDLITHQGAPKKGGFVECKITPDISSILKEILDDLNEKLLERMVEIAKEFASSQSKIKNSLNEITSDSNNIGKGVAGAIEKVA